MLWSTQGDAFGFNIFVAKESAGYAWRKLATLSAEGIEADKWIGNACVTNDGESIAVVYAPRTFTNDPTLLTHGAFASLVNVSTGEQQYVGRGYSLAHFNPSCGFGSRVVLSQFSDDTLKTRLTLLDAANPNQLTTVAVDSQLTSATADEHGLIAAAGGQIVRVGADGTTSKLAATTGSAYDLIVDSQSGLGYVQHDGNTATVQRIMLDATNSKDSSRDQLKGSQNLQVPVEIARGPIDSIGLGRNAAGMVYVLGDAKSVHGDLPNSWIQLDVHPDARISTQGHGVVMDTQPFVEPSRTADTLSPHLQLKVDIRLVGSGKDVSLLASADSLPSTAIALPSANVEIPEASLRSGNSVAGYGPGSSTNPIEAERTCAIPRNDPANQALQPLPRQVEWAVDQGVSKNLTISRPANWKNLGMPAYTPQGMFPLRNLVGGGDIPAQVMLGILAQESNLWQASRYTVPGVTGNPLIGNYYGINYGNTGTSWWEVDFSDADCGYGVAQITDGMRMAGREEGRVAALSLNKQRAIALDYAANIAKSLDMLADKWNATTSAGMQINDGDPQYIENWFFAVWAYNSGFHPQNGGAPWGVGWLNNPINPLWDQSRTPFLDGSPSDASEPQKWPYPEKVLGFAAHSLELPETGSTTVMGFRTAWWPDTDGALGEVNRQNVRPPIALFCVPTVNNCDPNASVQPNDPLEKPGPCLHKNASGDYDLLCYYHGQAEWKSNCAATCGHSFIRFSANSPAEPDGLAFLPNCSGTGLPTGAMVVDNLPNGTPVVRGNCPTAVTTTGSFQFNFASDNNGSYPAKMDLHQLGGGLNGQFYFSHTRASDAENYYNGKMNITGTWSLGQSLNSWARVLVHVPDHGAWTQQAQYTIDTGANGTQMRTLQQKNYENTWLSLGVFEFSGVPKVILTNNSFNKSLSGLDDVAWDAVAFVPLSQKPKDFVVALGDSFSSGEGASTPDGADYYRSSNNLGFPETSIPDNPYRNSCHRSKEAWSRKATLASYPSSTIGSRADSLNANMDYHLLACSGAETHHLLPFYSAGPTKPTDNLGRNGSETQFGELSQLDQGFLDANTTLVTLSIGGNDARFADILKACASVVFCPDSTLEGDSEKLSISTDTRLQNDVYTGVVRVLEQIHKKAPNAKILLVGYPKLFETGSTCILVPEMDREWLNIVTDELNLMLQYAANDSGPFVMFQNPSPEFTGRNLCTGNSAINNLVLTQTAGEDSTWQFPQPGPDFGVGISQQSVHPNKDGTMLYANVMNSALAATSRVAISGSLTPSPSPTYFSTFRYHSSGPAAFRMDTVPNCTGGTRLGLRLSDGNGAYGQQHTDTLEWDTPHTTQYFAWIKTPPTTFTLPSGSYAFNGRQAGTCTTSGSQVWGGELTW